MLSLLENSGWLHEKQVLTAY